MKAQLRRITRRVILSFPGSKAIRRTIPRAAPSFGEMVIRAMGGSEGVFTRIYEEKSWTSDESVSGPGSTIEYTQNIREEIPRIVDRLGVKRILDAPCGDYNWFRLIERDPDISYIGGDIVDALVISNQERYGNDTTHFIALDVANGALPEVDLWLCRDCLNHLPNDTIFKTINNFLNSDITWLLTSSHPNCETNTNILTGQFRPLNLELPPFSFCKPRLFVNDWIEGHPVKHLALWERRELSEALVSNKAFQRAVQRFRD